MHTDIVASRCTHRIHTIFGDFFFLIRARKSSRVDLDPKGQVVLHGRQSYTADDLTIWKYNSSNYNRYLLM